MINETQLQIQDKIIQKVLEFYKKERFGHLNVGMRVGKSFCAISIIRKLYDYNCTILLSYPDNSQIENWQKEFIKWKYNNPNIEYCNFSSLHKYQTKIFDVFLLDEWHSLSPKELEIAKEISNNDEDSITLALSGTVSKETQNNWKELKEIAKYTLNEAIRDKIIANYEIEVHLVDLDTKIKSPNKKGKLVSEKDRYNNYSFVIQQMKYKGNNFMHLALARNRLSLSSIGKVNYLKKLLKQFKNSRIIVFTGLSEVADNIGIPSFHSKSENDDNLQKFQQGEINHLALVEKGKTGITYKGLDCVILLNFTYNAENSAQGISRALQLDYTEKTAKIIIIALKEPPEIKKVKGSLSMLNQSKIKYI